MSRINTNISSLVAQKALTRSNSQLQQSLDRLSTGLRINSGKDDPAGLIASENLRRDITSTQVAISNTERANQLISTADSALGQVSGLLNDIRGLVVEAANTGVLSDEQIAANQLQVDSSLEAIDRIAKVTTFQGRKLLDGSLDFTKTFSAGQSSVVDLSINQANLGSAGSVSVSVAISSAATQAQLTDTTFGSGTVTQASGTVALSNSGAFLNVAATSGGAADGAVANATDVTFRAAADIAQAAGNITLTNSPGTINLAATAGGAADGAAGNATDVKFQRASDAVLATGSVSLTNTAGSFTVTAAAGGVADGTTGNAVKVIIAEGTGATSASYNATNKTITINVDDSIVGGDTVQNISDAINTDLAGKFTSTTSTGSAQYDNTDDATFNNVTANGANGTTGARYNATTNQVTVDVGVGDTVTNVASALNGLAEFAASATAGGSNVFAFTDLATSSNPLSGGNDGTTAAAYDATANSITVDVGLGATVANVATAISTDLSGDFSASATAGGTSAFKVADFGTKTDPLSGGTSAGLGADLVARISGAAGSEVLSFKAGTTIGQVVSAINLVSDSTGVTANNNNNTLELTSSKYGSAGLVDVQVVSEGAGGTFGSGLSATRANGTDVVGTVNGYQANGKGNTLSINNSTLSLSLTVDDGSSTSVDFSITGGGAVFQVGPNVVTNNQVRFGIKSVDSSTLGGNSGKLYQLRSGNDSDLVNNSTNAASIVDDAINAVTGLRGRIGAFQKTTLETNIATLSDTVTNLTDAQSSIRDADFAKETANLTRAQILVQSGTAVLQIANQNPQNVLSLLRG